MRKRQRRVVDLGAVELRAAVARPTANTEERTVEALFYSGAEVVQSSFMEGDFLLTLSTQPRHVRMDFLASGAAPVLDSHQRYGGVQAQLGVVQSARLEKGQGRATLRFSSRPEMDGVWHDIQDGILQNLSVGATIYKLEEQGTDKATGMKRFLATDWEPREISVVPIGADQGARMQLSDTPSRQCTLYTFSADGTAPNGGGSMRIKVRLKMDVEELGVVGDVVEIDESDFDAELHDRVMASRAGRRQAADPTAQDGDPGDSPVTAARLVDADIERQRALAAEIGRVAEYYGLDELWSRRHVQLGTPIKKVIELAAEERARRAPTTLNGVGEDRESAPYRYEQMALAIAARAARKEVPDSARAYADTTLVEMAHACLAENRMARGLNPRRHSARIVELALTTSDYPNLLANAANKVLLPDYEQAMPTYRMLCERQDLPDFKTASVLKAGDFPVPLQVAEEGEIKLGYFTEAKDTYALATYGRRLLFSLQALVNDDLAAFGRIMRGAAVRLADFENSLYFTLLTSGGGVGPTLGDSVALFHTASHGNYTSSGTAISVDSLGVGRSLMRKQTSLDGLKLNLVPRYLLTSPDKETIARQYTTLIGPNVAPSSQNPWAGTLEPIADANLSSANPWYLVADPARATTAVYGYLSGQSGPNVATRQGFEVLGVEMRVALHFGVAFVDYRGIYRNAGA